MCRFDQTSAGSPRYGLRPKSGFRSCVMRLSKFASVFCTAVMSAAFVIVAPSASAAGNDPCKVLTAEKFSQIMGYTASIIKNASTATTCFYQGPHDSGGQFMIL